MPRDDAERGAWPTYRPHLPIERAEHRGDWHGYVGVDNYQQVTELVRNVVLPGRTFIVTRTDGFKRPAVKAGLTAYLRDDRAAVRASITTRWCGFHVELAPGYEGFGASGEDRASIGLDGGGLLTGAEIRDYLDSDRPGREQFEWSYVDIIGGLGEPNHQDRITIYDQNSNGYRKIIDVIPCDIPWAQLHERDAQALDAAFAALNVEHPTEYDPAYDIPADDAETARQVLTKMAASLRKWREPLTGHQTTYPAVPGKYL